MPPVLMCIGGIRKAESVHALLPNVLTLITTFLTSTPQHLGYYQQLTVILIWMKLLSPLCLVSSMLLLVVVAESVTLNHHLNTTLASVDRCNKELNMTATVFVKNDRQVLILLPVENNDSVSHDEAEERYIECLQSISELTTFTIFEDSPEKFSEIHECQLSDATTWFEGNRPGDPVVALPLDDLMDLASNVLVKGLASKLLYSYSLGFVKQVNDWVLEGILGLRFSDILR